MLPNSSHLPSAAQLPSTGTSNIVSEGIKEAPEPGSGNNSVQNLRLDASGHPRLSTASSGNARGGPILRGRGRGSQARTTPGRALRGRRGALGRGRRRAGGEGRVGANVQDPSLGWTFSTSTTSEVIMEQEFANYLIQERARLLCSTFVNKINLQCSVRGITPTRAGFVMLIMNGILQKLTEWVNELVRVKNMESILALSDMHRYISDFLLSHTTGFSFEKAIMIQRQNGCVAPSLEITRFIADNILAFSPTGRVGDGSNTWNAQRDRTRQLSEFESLAFRESRKVFFSPCIC